MTARSSPSDLQQLARQIAAEPTDSQHLDVAAAQIMSGRGKLVYEELYRIVEEPGREHTLSTLMQLVESIMSVREDVGAYLMGRLYVHAGSSHAHDVYNAIELWMNDSRSPDVAQALLRLASEQGRPRLKRLYKLWADSIERRRRL
jgi:hypothetical protein